jgi:hemoglobin
MRVRAAVAVGLFVVAAGVAAAQSGPLDRVEQDKRTARVVHDSALLGSELFNKGNHEGCFRLYQGTLLAVQPMLDHRPKLAALVKDRLDKAAPLRAAEGAFVLREALDAVQAETAAALVPTKDMKGTTDVKKGTALWDRLGGEKTVRLVVKDFVATVALDPKVNVTRNGKYKLDEKGVATLENSLVEYVSEATGGPLKYSGKSMAAVHAGMKITEDEFNSMYVHLTIALRKNKVPQAESYELTQIIGATRRDIVGK